MSANDRLEKAHCFILKHLIEKGYAPFYTEIASKLQVEPEKGRKILHSLFAAGVPGWVFVLAIT
jgi:hypothetical protein